MTEQKMDKLAAQPPNEECWICFNHENNTTLTSLNFGKLLKNCTSYLATSIITKSVENETSVSCCSYCYESAHQLTIVKEQIENLQNEISGLGLLFSKNILERRNRVLIEKQQSAKTSTPQTDIFLAIDKNTNPYFASTGTENLSVKEEFIESASYELRSDYHENSEIVDFFNDPLLNTNEHENCIQAKCDLDTHFEEDTDSYNDAKTTILRNETTSAIIVQGDHQTIKASMTDLLKCLKTPVIHLERIQPCRIGNSQMIVADAVEEKMKCELDLDENKPYKYAICGIGFDEVGDLEDHDKLHNKEGSSYTCLVCDKSFLKPSLLEEHKRSHTKNKSSEKRLFTCSFCSKSFKLARNLKYHEAIHSEEKPYRCSFCEKSFLQPNELKIHERLHTGERPFKCCLCSKSFHTLRILKGHEKSHTGERPFKCSSCSKSYTRSNHLRDHLQVIHSGKKPYQCFICSKTFANASTLKVHDRIHSGERPYKCPNCDKRFYRNNHLTSHLQHKHRQDKEEFILP